MLGADRFIDHISSKEQALHATQRYQRGYSDIDMWNSDLFIANAVVACCDWHIAQSSTSPWHMEKNEWNQILQEIRDGFSRTSTSGAPKPTKRAWKLLRKHFRYFWN